MQQRRLRHAIARDSERDVHNIMSKTRVHPDRPLDNGLTPLTLALSLGKKGVVGLLSKKGANVNAPNDDGSRAIHHAIESPMVSSGSLRTILRRASVQQGSSVQRLLVERSRRTF